MTGEIQDGFTGAMNRFEALGADDAAVTPEDLIQGLGDLEQAGTQELAASSLSSADLARGMVRALEHTGEITVEPPLDEEQIAFVTGKTAVYSQLLASTETTAQGPTDTGTQKTDKRKA